MIPKIVLRYSWVYDEQWKNSSKKKKRYPSPKRIERFVKKVEKLWRIDERKILNELQNVTKLKWKRDITCYVVGEGIAFSDPLTLPMIEKYPDYFIDILIHELLHQLLFVQNEVETKKAWAYIFKKYKKEALNTKIHIPVHAVHKHIYMKFFNESRLKRDINLVKFKPDYRRAWEIVQKDGYQNIINEFTKRIK